MNVQEQIKNIVEENSVMLFMKGSPDFPQCGFSGRLVQILQACGAQFASADVLLDDQIRQGIKDFSNWPTIPQLYINGELDVSVKKDGEIANPGDPLSLGKYGAETYIGGIDEVFIYDRALSTEELKELLKGFESAFSVDPSEKLATKWATLKM